MRTRLQLCALLCILSVGAGCRVRPSTELAERGARRDTLSRQELAEALQNTPMQSADRSARGDSVARLAHAAYWHIEGGDFEIGGRMMRYAFRMGWREPVFSDADWFQIIGATSDPGAWRALGRDLLAREPGSALGRFFQAAADSAAARQARMRR